MRVFRVISVRKAEVFPGQVNRMMAPASGRKTDRGAWDWKRRTALGRCWRCVVCEGEPLGGWFVVLTVGIRSKSFNKSLISNVSQVQQLSNGFVMFYVE